MPKRRPPAPLPGQGSVASWLLANKVEDETDSEPEGSGLGGLDPQTPLPREEEEEARGRSAAPVRRSLRVAGLRGTPACPSPLGSPCSQASVHSTATTVSMGESDDDLDPDFRPTRDIQQQISDGGKNQYI